MEAYQWWHLIKPTLWQKRQVTWDIFVEAFLEYYFPYNAQERYEAKFRRLTQGDMSIVDYEATFTRLTHFDNTMPIEHKKASKF